MNKSRVAADRILLRHGASILYVVVVLLVGVSLVRLPSFRAPGNLSNLVLRSVPLMAVSLAQTVVLITGGIDLSVGAVLALTTTIASVTMQHNIFLGIIVSLLISAAVGLFNGLAVAKLKINPFLVTLSTTIIVNGIALFVRPYPGGFIPPVYVSSVMRSVGVVPVGVRALSSKRPSSDVTCTRLVATGTPPGWRVSTRMELPWAHMCSAVSLRLWADCT